MGMVIAWVLTAVHRRSRADSSARLRCKTTPARVARGRWAALESRRSASAPFVDCRACQQGPPRRALVTGITGQDGSYLAELLRRDAATRSSGWCAPERDAPDLAAASTTTLVSGDLADPDVAARAVARRRRARRALPPRRADVRARVLGGPGRDAAADRGRDGDAAARRAERHGHARARGELERGLRRRRRVAAARGLADAPALAVRRREARGASARRRATAGHGLHASSAITFNHESPRRPERFLPRKVTRGAAAIKLGLQDELALGDLDAVRDWSARARRRARRRCSTLEHDEPGDYVFASGVGRTVRRARRRGVRASSASIRPTTCASTRRSCARRRRRRRSATRRARATRAGLGARDLASRTMIGEMVDADLADLRATAR